MEFEDLVDEFDADSDEGRGEKQKGTTSSLYPSIKSTRKSSKASSPSGLYPSIPTPTPPPAAAPSSGKESASDTSTKLKKSQVAELESLWRSALEESTPFKSQTCDLYAKLFASKGIDEAAARKLTDSSLKVMGLTKSSHRKEVLKLIKQLEQENATQQEVATTESKPPSLERIWFSLLLKDGFAIPDAAKYATGLASNGVDETVAVELDDDMLKRGGITDSSHREQILCMIDRMVGHDSDDGTDQDEVADENVDLEHEMNNTDAPEELSVDVAEGANLPTDGDVDKARRDIEVSLEHYNMFQAKLAKVLSGDTKKQREARALRASARSQRRRERAERRRNKLVKQAADSMQELSMLKKKG